MSLGCQIPLKSLLKLLRTMAVRSKIGISGIKFEPGKPKCTRQGKSKNTKYAATSRNSARKKYRGQGKG